MVHDRNLCRLAAAARDGRVFHQIVATAPGREVNALVDSGWPDPVDREVPSPPICPAIGASPTVSPARRSARSATAFPRSRRCLAVVRCEKRHPSERIHPMNRRKVVPNPSALTSCFAPPLLRLSARRTAGARRAHRPLPIRRMEEDRRTRRDCRDRTLRLRNRPRGNEQPRRRQTRGRRAASRHPRHAARGQATDPPCRTAQIERHSKFPGPPTLMKANVHFTCVVLAALANASFMSGAELSPRSGLLPVRKDPHAGQG